MASERITVTITSSIGGDGPLTVNDAARQLIDVFGLLQDAGGEDAKSIDWQIIEVSMQSPLRVIAQAFSLDHSIAAEPIARREKIALKQTISQIVRSERVPDWMEGEPLERAKRFFSRTLNGISRTDLILDDAAPDLELIVIAASSATSALAAIERHEIERAARVGNLSRSEFGSIEANVLDATTHYGQPALRLSDRIAKTVFPCVFSPELAERLGPAHSWAEVWSNRRVLVSGRITYRSDGRIGLIVAGELENIDSPTLSYKDFADPRFTGGKRVSEYVDSLWEEDGG